MIDQKHLDAERDAARIAAITEEVKAGTADKRKALTDSVTRVRRLEASGLDISSPQMRDASLEIMNNFKALEDKAEPILARHQLSGKTKQRRR